MGKYSFARRLLDTRTKVSVVRLTLPNTTLFWVNAEDVSAHLRLIRWCMWDADMELEQQSGAQQWISLAEYGEKKVMM